MTDKGMKRSGLGLLFKKCEIIATMIIKRLLLKLSKVNDFFSACKAFPGYSFSIVLHSVRLDFVFILYIDIKYNIDPGSFYL